MNLLLIPARAGSKRIPDKNMQSVGGKPLVQWAIEVANECTGHVVVSSDSQTILELAERNGVEALWRPPELARDDTPMSEVVHHALRHRSRPDNIVLLQPTTPQRTSQHVERAAAHVQFHKGQTVCTVNPDGRRNGAAYVVPWSRIGSCQSWLSPGALWGDTWIAFETPAMIDINTPEDLEEARRLLGP